jgi:hypothetical protein
MEAGSIPMASRGNAIIQFDQRLCLIFAEQIAGNPAACPSAAF